MNTQPQTSPRREKFTPGPWATDYDKNYNRFNLRSKVAGSFGHFCGWSSDGVTTEGEDEANSQLIAAAPELYQACLAMCNSLTEGDDAKALQMAFYAIAKVQGPL